MIAAFGFPPTQRRKLLGELFLKLWNEELNTWFVDHLVATGEIETISDLIDKLDIEMEMFIEDPSGWDLDYPCEETMIGVA